MNEYQKAHLKACREKLCEAQMAFPAVTEEWQKLHEMIAEIEAMLGII